MRIERIAFRNFRAYRGKVEIEFPPSGDPARQVYLIGGENGAGKTSFLMALGFALFGVDSDGVSFHSGRREPKDAYKSAIEECFNRHAHVDGESSMSVSAYIETNGEHYEIHREWWFEDRRLVDEDVRIRVSGRAVSTPGVDVTTIDGRRDAVAQLMETVLPARAARFFFFDGEEVASIAERDLGKSVISGLDDLLGLDSVGKLNAELQRIERRERDRLRQGGEAVEYDECRRTHSEAERLLMRAREELAEAREQLGVLEVRLESTNHELELLFDGHAVDGVAELREELSRHQSELEELGREFNRSLGDSLGAVASHELLVALRPRVIDAARSRQDREIRSAASERVAEVATRLLRRKVSPPLTADQKKQLRAHLVDVSAQLDAEAPLGDEGLALLTDADLERLATRVASDSIDAFGALREQARRRMELKRRIRLVESHLRRFQESSAASELIERRGLDAAAIEAQQLVVTALDEAARTAEEHAKETQEAVMAAEENLAGMQLGAAKIRTARQARRAFEKFATEVRTRRAYELEGGVSKTLQRLLHRTGALERVEIDAGSSTVRLLDGRGEEIPVPSAGEKEIFALSLIHGLGRLSHRDAPLVIDTPLGRLDKAHREAIVAEFMPTASHQVIVLSTDSEVDDELYDLLAPHLAWQATIRSTDQGAVVAVGDYFGRGAS